MKIQKFRNRLQNLEFDISDLFRDLLKEKGKFKLNDIEDFENIDDYFEVRNDITGNVFDVFILEVSNNGLWAVNAEDKTTDYFLKFSDLSSVLDRINLVELMYLQTQK